MNAYDAINVVANCTAPVATQVTTTACSVRLKGEEASQQQQQHQEWGWEGLASFLFGPDWISIPLEGEEVDNTTSHAVNATSSSSSSSSGESITSVAGAAIHHANGKSSLQVNGHSPPLMLQQPKVGGKMLNSVGNGKELSNMITAGSTTEKGRVTFALDRRNSKGGIVSGGDGRALETKVGDSSLCNIGWNAPYPNTIPAFPLVTNPEVVANPHRWSSGSRILATDIETCRESAATMDNKLQRNNDGPDNNDNNSKIAQLRDEVADRAMRAALRIPDDVFTKFDTVWGMIDNNSSSSLTNTNQKKTSSVATTATAASKQTVVLLSTKSNQNTTIDTVRPIIRHHASPYVPNFLPPYPTDYYSDMASNNLSASMATTAVRDNFLSRMYHTNRGEKRKSSLDPAVTTSSSSSSSGDGNINKRIDVSERDNIRRSVIGLGRAVGPKYWGSVNLDDDDDDDDISNNTAGRDTMMRSKSTISNPGSVSVESSSLSSSSNKKSSLDASQVSPLGRASGSRVRFRIEYLTSFLFREKKLTHTPPISHNPSNHHMHTLNITAVQNIGR